MSRNGKEKYVYLLLGYRMAYYSPFEVLGELLAETITDLQSNQKKEMFARHVILHLFLVLKSTPGEEGATYKELAEKSGYSKRQVKRIIKNDYKKFDLVRDSGVKGRWGKEGSRKTGSIYHHPPRFWKLKRVEENVKRLKEMGEKKRNEERKKLLLKTVGWMLRPGLLIFGVITGSIYRGLKKMVRPICESWKSILSFLKESFLEEEMFDKEGRLEIDEEIRKKVRKEKEGGGSSLGLATLLYNTILHPFFLFIEAVEGIKGGEEKKTAIKHLMDDLKEHFSKFREEVLEAMEIDIPPVAVPPLDKPSFKKRSKSLETFIHPEFRESEKKRK